MVRGLLSCVAVLIAILLVEGKSLAADDALLLTAGESELLRVEPILVTLQLRSDRLNSLPHSPGESAAGTLRFEIDPEVKPRSGAKPLPLEAQASTTGPQSRDYDLLEWFQFPGEGKFTVRAVFEQNGVELTSKPITFSIQSPQGDDVELPSVSRIHHPPWCNYGTNKFCGDTFDLVNRWPDSRLAKYCHYWNGRFLQNNKEYEKAIESFRHVIEIDPDFALADDADFGIVECMYLQGQFDAASKQNATVRQKYQNQATKSGQSIVLRLSEDMAAKIKEARDSN